VKEGGFPRRGNILLARGGACGTPGKGMCEGESREEKCD